ncbi:MAG: arylsulfotransferase family protein [Acidobacteriota bacterium]
MLFGSDGAGEGTPEAAPATGTAGASPDAPPPRRVREPESGKWRRARTGGAGGTGASEAGDWQRPEAAEALMAMPYLQGYRPASGRQGTVRVARPEEVQPGLNLYTSGHAPEATLIDRDGRVLHRWGYPLDRFRPELYEDGRGGRIRKVEYFRRARLLPTGELLAIYEGLGLVKLAPDSRLVWGYRGGAHHDLDVAEDGSVWVLDREGKLLPRIDPEEGVLEDFVTVLSPDGRVRRKISILEAFERSDYAALLHRMPDRPDILHTNTLEILDGRSAGTNPAFRAGNLLLSVLELDAVAVLDPETETIVWALAGLWRKQHQPTIVGTDRMMVFDNLGAGGERSRVLELDPFTQRIAWRYEENLYSKTLGSCQRLANGNTLITESENGRAIEVTPDGAVAWEFLTPHRVAADDGSGAELVAVLFEVERLPTDFPFRGGRRAVESSP